MRSALFFMNGRTIPVGLTLLIIALALLTALAIANTAPPNIETEFGGATVKITSDRAWAILPAQCANISWQMQGILSVYIDGQGAIGWGELNYCPALNATSPQFEVTSENGEEALLALDIRYLPLELLRSLLLFLLLACMLIALYRLFARRYEFSLLRNATFWLALLALFCACLLGQTGEVRLTQSFIAGISSLFQSFAWQTFALLLAGIVYIPLIVRALKVGRERKAHADFAALAACFLFLLLLYLPLGFDSIGHWEEWVIKAYFEGRPSKFSSELVTRFWSIAPHALAYIIDSDSFAGYHFVNLLMLWGKLVLLYGSLRKLSFAPLFAFLLTLLYMVYPVNSMLLSLRSMPMHFSMLGLLAALYFALDYQSQPNRLTLLGMWLGLLFNIGANESGYALILCLPVLFWACQPMRHKPNIDLTINGYVLPASKVIFLLLLASHRIAFYGNDRFDIEASGQSLAEAASRLFSDLASLYQVTFISGWGDAVASLAQSAWLGWTALLLAPVLLTAVFLLRAQNVSSLPSARAAFALLIVALLGLVPAVGVLIWFESYSQDLWRLYFYAPVFAAIAVFAIMLLLTARLPSESLRKILLLALFLLLIIPSVNRLLMQRQRLTQNADDKAAVLLSVMEQAPAFDANAIAILLTHKSVKDIEKSSIREFESNMLDSAFHVLWQDRGPQFAFLCAIFKYCHPNDIDYFKYELNEAEDYSEIVIFQLQDDLAVELLYELPPELGGASNATYNPARLIDASAPLPPRALTMLAAARR